MLAVSFLPFVMASLFSTLGIRSRSADEFVQYRYLNGILIELTSLALLWYVVKQNRQKLSDVGLVFRPADIPYGILLWVFSLCCYTLVSPTILSVCESLGWHRAEPYLPSARLGFSAVAYVFIFLNPFFEEMIVRGFLISEVTALTGSSVVAVFVSVLLQVSYHIYQGVPYALSAGVTFLIFSIYYVRTKRIVAIITAHFIFDLLGHVSSVLHAHLVHT